MNPVKVAFVVPPYFNADDYLNKERAAVLPAFTIPYGLLSMDIYLRTHCRAPVEISILDLNTVLRDYLARAESRSYAEVFQEHIGSFIRSVGPHVVGLSALFNSSFRYLGEFAQAVRAEAPDAVIVAGGGLPSAAFMKVLDLCPAIDAVCRGEGEIPMRELVDSTDRRRTLREHASWVCREGLRNGKIPAHTFIQDLDEIPPLDYTRLNLDDYNSRSIDKRFTGVPKREMAIHTSRGCPFLCVFCSNPALHGRDVRTMSVNKVALEVRRMKEEFGMTVLMIEDDHFFHDKERAKEVLRRLIELEVRVEFPNGVAVYAIDEEVASLFSKAGVSSVALAVESGSDFVLNKIIKKPLKKKLIRPAVDALRKYNVMSHVFIVAGLPGEQDEHRQETLQMLIDSGFDWAHIYCAIPIFGSRLYDICVDNGYIENTNPLDFINTKSVIRAPGVDPEKIERFAYDVNLLVNFVHNTNMKLGHYDVALKYFHNVIDKYPDHALGHYCVAQALIASGGPAAEAEAHMGTYTAILQRDDWWRRKVAQHAPSWLPEKQAEPLLAAG